MIHLISLNELTLPMFLVLALMRRSVKVLRIAPFVPKAKGFLQRVTEWAIQTDRAEYAVTLAPELKQYWEFERRFYFQEVFTKYEPWQNRYYGFNRQEIARDPLYGYAYKKMTCSYTYWKVIEVYLLDAITRKLADGKYRVHGVLEDTLALGRDRFGDSFASSVTPMAFPRFLVRGILVLLSLAFTFTWLVSRIRPSVRTEKINIAFERLNDPRDFELFGEISDAGRFLVIYRSQADFDAPKLLPGELDYSSCLRTDGLFSPAGALAGAAMAVRDVFRIARRHKDAPPALLYEMLSLPFKRLLIRGLLNCYRPDYFLSRDEYNVDHIMRQAELQPLSIKSIGLSNGLFPSFSSLSPNIRYVSFDTYFVFGAPLSAQYLDTWAPDMKIRSIIAYSVPREKMVPPKKPRTDAIVFTMRVAWNEPAFVPMVRAVAKAFPNRKVYVQFKPWFINEEDVARLAGECSKGLVNVYHTTENVYILLDRAKYHISDLSSLVIEAIAMGMTTFMADLIDMEYTCFWQFPGLCVTSGEELVAKLRALDTGETTYPRQEYFKVLGCKQDEITYDLIREEIGLPSRADLPVTAKAE